MKLRKLKTTIVSSLALFSVISCCYANYFNVDEYTGHYLIVVETERIHSTKSGQRAAIKAKAQLAHYLKPRSKSATIEIKHFQIVDKKDYSDKSVYRFKVNKKDIWIVK